MAIKVLYIISSLGGDSGADRHAVSLFLAMPSAEISADFLVIHHKEREELAPALRERGCKVFYLPPILNVPAGLRAMRKILAGGGYDVLHCHTPAVSGPLLQQARRCRTPLRILNVHASRQSEQWYKRAAVAMLMKWSLRNADKLLAVSALAGRSAYGRRGFDLVPAAIELADYGFSPSARREVRQKLHIPDEALLIGAVGRVTRQKNPLFMAEIAAALTQLEPDCWFCWIGDGPLRREAEDRVRQLGGSERTLFLGAVPARDYYSAMDALALPSLYEGLPAVGIEAQANALPLLAADTVTAELALTPSVQFYALDNSPRQWAGKLLELAASRPRDGGMVNRQALAAAGYEVKEAAAALLHSYGAYLSTSRGKGEAQGGLSLA